MISRQSRENLRWSINEPLAEIDTFANQDPYCQTGWTSIISTLRCIYIECCFAKACVISQCLGHYTNICVIAQNLKYLRMLVMTNCKINSWVCYLHYWKFCSFVQEDMQKLLEKSPDIYFIIQSVKKSSRNAWLCTSKVRFNGKKQ